GMARAEPQRVRASLCESMPPSGHRTPSAARAPAGDRLRRLALAPVEATARAPMVRPVPDCGGGIADGRGCGILGDVIGSAAFYFFYGSGSPAAVGHA